MSITHILFDLHGVLLESGRIPPCYSDNLGQVMAERFGGDAESWTRANLSVLSDWDSYYADLDLTGDNGIDDLWEGMFRTTRALFRLTNTPEPDTQTLTELSRELPFLATRFCDVLYPDSKPVLERLHAAGYVVGVASQAVSALTRGILTGGGVLDLVTGAILGPDVTGRFQKDALFYQTAGGEPSQCLAVVHTLEAVWGAKSAGMHTVCLRRDGRVEASPADHHLEGDLHSLLAYLGV